MTARDHGGLCPFCGEDQLVVSDWVTARRVCLSCTRTWSGGRVEPRKSRLGAASTATQPLASQLRAESTWLPTL